MRFSQKIKFISGPFIAIIFFILAPQSGALLEMRMAGVALWMAAWWLTEAVELPVTGLLPFILIPLLGIADAKTIAMQYMDQIIFLFMGGFMLSFALEKCNLHQRIALKILAHIGNSANKILAGIMITAFCISMWMSNTATVMMLYAAVISILKHLQTSKDDNTVKKLGACLMLGLAYSASIGGMATLVGTPTNMIFYSFYNNNFPHDKQLVFSTWFQIGFPIALLLCITTYYILKHQFKFSNAQNLFNINYFKTQYNSLGKMNRDEKIVATLFIFTSFLWFSRADIIIGTFTIKGWSSLFIFPNYIQDSTVAIGMAFILFLIPSKKTPSQNLLTWNDCKKLPLGIMILFGSGFALSKGFEASGLSNLLANSLQFLNGKSVLLIILSVVILVTIISEFASNVASIQLVLPLLMALATAIHVSPLLLMLPATFAASLGFMLPVATAPNTIVFGSNYIDAKQMYKAGLWVNLFGILFITLAIYYFMPMVINIK